MDSRGSEPFQGPRDGDEAGVAFLGEGGEIAAGGFSRAALDHAAPCTAIVPAGRTGHPDKGAIWLKVNGETRQQGDLSELIWSVPETIAHLSALFALAPGDLIFTGTPAGVGPVVPGDRLHGGVAGLGEIKITVV